MKKLTNSNPFLLLLVPVCFAILMGVGYQFHQKKDIIVGRTVQATSLFYKGVSLFKTMVSVSKEKVW